MEPATRTHRDRRLRDDDGTDADLARLPEHAGGVPRTTFGDHRSGIENWAAILFGNAAIALDGTVTA